MTTPTIKSTQKQLLAFIVKAVLLYIVWVLIYDFYIQPAQKIDAWLNYRVATESSLFLKLFGFNGSTLPGINQTIVQIDGVGMVGVGNPCNGLELFVLFAGFIICFPGSYKNKLWYIPVGLIVIHLVNAFRTFSLSLIQLKAPEYLDFNHHYTFTVIVYLLIFYLWIIWVNKYSNIDLSNKHAIK